MEALTGLVVPQEALRSPHSAECRTLETKCLWLSEGTYLREKEYLLMSRSDTAYCVHEMSNPDLGLPETSHFIASKGLDLSLSVSRIRQCLCPHCRNAKTMGQIRRKPGTVLDFGAGKQVEGHKNFF